MLPTLMVGVLLAASSDNPRIYENSDYFAKNSLGPRHVFDPNEQELYCPKSIDLLFEPGPRLGFCFPDEAPRQTVAGHYAISEGEELSVVVANPDGTRRQILTLGGAVGFPIDVDLTAKKRPLLTEQLEDQGRRYPFWRYKVQCDSITCRLEPKTCVLDVPPNLYPHAVAQVKAGSSDEKRRSDDFVNWVGNSSYHLLLQALGGDNKAGNTLLNFPIDLDGASAEILGTYQDAYREARDTCKGKK